MAQEILYQRNHPDPNWYAAGYPTIVVGAPPVVDPVDPTDPTLPRPPKSYDTLAAFLADNPRVPTNANFVMWTPANGRDPNVWARTLPSDAVMVYPKEYGDLEFDSSKGFRASDTTAMEYISDDDYRTKALQSDGRPYGSKYVTGMTPVEPTAGHWFSMLRVPRGIIMLGGGLVIPSDSGYKGQRQPKSSMGVYDRRDTQVPPRLFLHVGVQQKLIEPRHPSPIFWNFTLGTRDFGTIAYSGIAAGAAGGTPSIGRVHADKSWSGFAGIPNGEAGAIALGGTYDVVDVLLSTDDAFSSSPIMANRTQGGRMERVWVGKHRIGMITWWKAGGVNTFINVVTNAGTVGINLEEDLDDFVLNWISGRMMTTAAGTTKHLNIWPSQGSIEVHLGADFTATLNSGLALDKLVVHAYGASGVQKRSDVTSQGVPLGYVPPGLFIA